MVKTTRRLATCRSMLTLRELRNSQCWSSWKLVCERLDFDLIAPKTKLESSTIMPIVGMEISH
eukprot:5083239-Amphidinium_carterae.1